MYSFYQKYTFKKLDMKNPKESKKSETYNPEWNALNPDYLWQLPDEDYYNIPPVVDMQCWGGDEEE